MPKRLVAVFALCLSLAGAARAETQVFKGTFSLEGLADPAPVSTAFGVATVNGSGGGSHVATIALPGDLLSLHTTLLVTGGTLPLSRVEFDVTLGPGAFDVGPGGVLSGVLPAQGNARLCLLDCGLAFDVPLTVGGTRGVGIGGAAINVPLGAFGQLALLGKPWETGVAEVLTSLGSSVRTGFAHGPLSATSSTADPQGVLQMVTPVRVGAVIGGGAEQVLPLFGVLEVKLLPEPGAAASLGAGAALLAFLGGKRRRRAQRAAGERSSEK